MPPKRQTKTPIVRQRTELSTWFSALEESQMTMGAPDLAFRFFRREPEGVDDVRGNLECELWHMCGDLTVHYDPEDDPEDDAEGHARRSRSRKAQARTMASGTSPWRRKRPQVSPMRLPRRVLTA